MSTDRVVIASKDGRKVFSFDFAPASKKNYFNLSLQGLNYKLYETHFFDDNLLIFYNNLDN